ncbi:MAG: hypothetical protein JWM02_1042 [Frankiales bacterium]|nr:hypothetical protein [Frankiales bacterium]
MTQPVKPARGVDLAQVLPVTAVLAIVAVAVLVLCALYRRGRLPLLERAAAWSERESGLPAWASVPAIVSSLSLFLAGFGFYWDVAVHIDNGRDNSPFGTPAHWPILVGLCGLALAGVLAITLDRNTDGGAAVALPGGLRCSLGAVLVLLCGSVSLAGFPLDDLWHATFGQDVTLWSPTHLQMIGGASLTTLASWVLVEEGRRRGGGARGANTLVARLLRPSAVGMAGALLVGLSTLQDEFDMGVPQFNSVYHPILIALAAGVGLVAARVRIGPGGAVRAAVVFLVLRGLWALLIAAMGLSVPHLPLYLAEALLVEGAALLVDPRKQVRYGVVAGALIGTVGVAVEWGYGQVAFVLPWQPVLFPEAYLLALVAAVSGGALGAMIGRALLPVQATRSATPRLAAGLAFAGSLVVVAVALPIGSHTSYTADVVVTAAGPSTADLTVTLHPASIATDVAWFNVTSWQGSRALVGGTGLQITLFDRIGPGVYRTQRPVPIAGDYKSVLRLATSSAQQAIPVYLPEDKGIPAAAVAASPTFTRSFVPDQQILQREAVGGSATLKRVAYAVLTLLALLWIATLSFGLRRLDRSAVTPLSPLALGLTRLPLLRRTAEGIDA